MSAEQQPSYEELAVLVVELRAEMAALRADNERLRVENVELRARLDKNSRNSSRPPSLDGLDKPAPKSLRTRSGRGPGGQAGHRGQTLCQVGDPVETVRHEPVCCRNCGSGLAGAAMAELFGAAMSGGTVATITGRAAARLQASGGFGERVREVIAGAPVAHFDETGMRVAGRLRWVHSASTGKYVLITVHDKRGVEAMNAAEVLPVFTGIAVHDGWAPYDTYTAATHARCNAHLLRELQAVIDHHTATAPAGTWCWAAQAAGALRTMKHLVDEALARDGTLGSLDLATMAEAKHDFRAAARFGVKATRARATKPEKDHNALARRMLQRHDDHLRFTVDAQVPFDNNASKREIQMIKVRQKVSGCLRTLSGAKQFVTIRSYLATAAKHGITLLHALTQLTTGRPWLPATA